MRKRIVTLFMECDHFVEISQICSVKVGATEWEQFMSDRICPSCGITRKVIGEEVRFEPPLEK